MIARKIWMYWENKPGHSRPPYLDLALETIKYHSGSYEIVLLDEQTVRDYLKIPRIVKRFAENAHKADYIRFNLLYQYGGVWLDCDLILLRNIEAAIEPFIANYDYIGYGREYGKPSISFMACQKGCQLLEMSLEEIDKFLLRKRWKHLPFNQVALGWNELGYDILWKFTNRYKYYHHERRMFAPTVWSDWKYFKRTDVDIDEYLSHNPFAVHFYNKMMFDEFKDVSIDKILNGDTLLSKLFRRSMKQSKIYMSDSANSPSAG
jgi:hypothetical protein